ncbi:MAG: hypothetical protein KDN22_20905 [Verrucomicrobiae bacterium]|nr:hypothetical protein [Verrucomicrobiae bacterium]
MKNYNQRHSLTVSSARGTIDKVISSLTDLDHKLNGRGITICAGGTLLYTNAWILVKMLRYLGNSDPVQIWYMGNTECDSRMKKLMEPYDIEFINALEIAAFELEGWSLKPFAIINSPFRHVIALDADNLPIVDPSYLLETEEYAAKGCIFWPDRGETEENAHIWEITGVAYRQEPEFETGQIVVDKERCWKALQLTMWMNINREFFYQYVWGDKDTFRFSWHILGQSFAMPTKGIEELALEGNEIGVMCQHDFQDERVFQHRSFPKWSFLGENPKVPGFLFEARCRQYLNQLRQQWDGLIEGASPVFPDTINGLTGTAFVLEGDNVPRLDNRRNLEFAANGTFRSGADDDVAFWHLGDLEGSRILTFLNQHHRTVATLLPEGAGWESWRGRWSGRPLANRDKIPDPSPALKLTDIRVRFPGCSPSLTRSQPRPFSKSVCVHTSALGIGDAVTGLLACVGLSRAGTMCTFHTQHEQWFRRVSEPNLEISMKPAPSEAVDLNQDYSAQLEFAEDKARWYAASLDPGTVPAMPMVDLSVTEHVFEFGEYVLLLPFCAAQERQWPAAHWARLGELLNDAGYEAIALGTGQHEEALVKMFGRTSVYWATDQAPSWIVSAMLTSSAVVGGDSGLTQIAALHSVPTVGIHSQLPAEFLWKHLDVSSVTSLTSCTHCRWREERGYRPHCEDRCSALLTIDPERVLAATLDRTRSR